jgi:hypothetical protein
VKKHSNGSLSGCVWLQGRQSQLHWLAWQRAGWAWASACSWLIACALCAECVCSPDLPEIWEEMDSTLAVTEGRVARPVCVVPTATISAVLYPVYGALEKGCNATTSYRCGAGMRSAAATWGWAG